MERTTTWTLALAALLMTAPAVAADEGPAPADADEQTTCDVFWYSTDPPGYKVDPSCVWEPGA